MEQMQQPRRQYWINLGMMLVFSLMASFQAREIILSGQNYKNGMTEVSQLLNFQDRLLNTKAWLFKSNRKESNSEKVALMLNMAKQNLKKAGQMGVLFGLLSLGFLLLSFIMNRGTPWLYQRMTQSVVLVAVFCLVVGVLSPMLEISAFMDDLVIPLDLDILGISVSKEFFFEGRMFFYYQNKSVVDLIQVLLKEHNYIVAYSIIGFSFLVPLLKLGSTMVLVTFRSLSSQSWPARLVGAIGKWSMADVFVAASFLAYLGFSNMNTGVQTESHTLIGLYFFFSYVILSICSGYFCNAALEDAEKGLG